MPYSRNNHYVPEWYQKGFSNTDGKLRYLDFAPQRKTLQDGRVITMNDRRWNPPSRCFCDYDLYTTFFGPFVNDEVERYLFGEIDNTGAKAVRAFIDADPALSHKYFSDFFMYMDAQKLRTPKGLAWIQSRYADIDQLQLMIEMQEVRTMHCTIWAEGVREIVSAKDAGVKFIVTDHPVAVYNYACPPSSTHCAFPSDPEIAKKATQTIFALDQDTCLILTNLEYAEQPKEVNPIENRTHARTHSQSIVRTDRFIRTRQLSSKEVEKINFILKCRATRYIAAAAEEWLHPENNIDVEWSGLAGVLLPPSDELSFFAGETYIGYADGSSRYQDAFGRTTKQPKILEKQIRDKKIGANELCPCGSGKKYKKCHPGLTLSEIPNSSVLSIRERNLRLFEIICNVLQPSKVNTWENIRANLSDDQVRIIHESYGMLWPIDTVVEELLPKPDDSISRVVYSGPIDPASIARCAASLVLYFDEIIIQNPIVNPANRKPEFSPTKSPSKFKQETLKSVMLLFELMPLIEAGYVIFVPDPCNHNSHLRRTSMRMAKERAKNIELDDETKSQIEQFRRDEFERAIKSLPRDILREQVRQSSPELNDERIEEILDQLHQERLADPLVLLQDVPLTEDGTQLVSWNIIPNFELSFYLAKITGACLLTDNRYRWMEMRDMAQRSTNHQKSAWESLSETLGKFRFPMIGHPMHCYELRRSGKLGELRRRIRNALAFMKQENSQTRIEALSVTHVEELDHAIATAIDEWESYLCKDADNRQEIRSYTFDSKISSISPKGGLYVQNVQRLLVAGGQSDNTVTVPAAFFMEVDFGN